MKHHANSKISVNSLLTKFLFLFILCGLFITRRKEFVNNLLRRQRGEKTVWFFITPVFLPITANEKNIITREQSENVG